MFDVKLLRSDLAAVQAAMQNRGKQIEELNGFTALDVKRRELLQETEQLKNRRNTVSQEVAGRKRSGENADELIQEMKVVGDRIKELDDEIRVLGRVLTTSSCSPSRICRMPAFLWAVRKKRMWKYAGLGRFLQFDFEVKPHWEVAQELGHFGFRSSGEGNGFAFRVLQRAWR